MATRYRIMHGYLRVTGLYPSRQPRYWLQRMTAGGWRNVARAHGGWFPNAEAYRSADDARAALTVLQLQESPVVVLDTDPNAQRPKRANGRRKRTAESHVRGIQLPPDVETRRR